MLASRVQLFKLVKPLEIKECPFTNIAGEEGGEILGRGSAAAKMAECCWAKLVLVGDSSCAKQQIRAATGRHKAEDVPYE